MLERVTSPAGARFDSLGLVAPGLKPRRGAIRQPRASPWVSAGANRQALKGRNNRSPIAPFQGLRNGRGVYPARCAGLSNRALSGLLGLSLCGPGARRRAIESRPFGACHIRSSTLPRLPAARRSPTIEVHPIITRSVHGRASTRLADQRLLTAARRPSHG